MEHAAYITFMVAAAALGTCGVLWALQKEPQMTQRPVCSVCGAADVPLARCDEHWKCLAHLDHEAASEIGITIECTSDFRPSMIRRPPFQSASKIAAGTPVVWDGNCVRPARAGESVEGFAVAETRVPKFCPTCGVDRLNRRVNVGACAMCSLPKPPPPKTPSPDIRVYREGGETRPLREAENRQRG